MASSCRTGIKRWDQANCVGMGLIKNEYGVYHVRRRVPKGLQAATARVTGVTKERVSWLKETLGTRDEKHAKVLAKPVMMKFDRILAQAEALLVEHPVRTELTEAEIKRIADYFYAHELNADQELREEGIGSDPVFASVAAKTTPQTPNRRGLRTSRVLLKRGVGWVGDDNK
jgi:hypothetical protein